MPFNVPISGDCILHLLPSIHRIACRAALLSQSMNLNYLIAVLCFVFWLVALVDCLGSNNPNKVLWVVLIILLPFLGSILSVVLGKTSRA